ncbi:MAG TPA: C4-dicarboxylate ABC transporter [Gammaproteobacteria bacterium]|nr:C4-dicarboxylate ABC transporter [Gammaproteobacteria bacterium]
MRTFAVALCCLLLPLGAVQAKTFKIATIVPDGTRWMKEMKAGAEDIKMRTHGRVRFRFYPGGVMGNDKAVVRKMRVGQLSGGALTGGGLALIYPDAQVYSLPMAFTSHEEVDYVRGKMDARLIDALYQAGYVSFGFSDGGFAYLMSNAPLTTIADLAGHKVWVPEGDVFSQAAFEAVHVSPIPLPLADVLTGLQTGLIDTVASSPIGALALQWHTKVKYATDMPLMYLIGTIVLKRRDFDRLSPADQMVVREVMSKVFRRLDRLNREDNGRALAALKAQGITFVEPTPQARQAWREAVGAAVDKLVRQGTISRRITDTFYSYLNAYRHGQR